MQLFTYAFQKVTVNGAHITEFDREGSNGVIHVIDHVMIPPTGDIVDIVSNTPELSTLLSLVSQAGLAGALKGKSISWVFVKKASEYDQKIPQSNTADQRMEPLRKATEKNSHTRKTNKLKTY